MPTISDSITTPDGPCPVTLAIPDGAGPWPAVVMYPDAGGARPAFREMAQRLASLGYVVLVPDVYYRYGDWAPFEMRTAFSDAAERNRLFAMMKSITPEVMEADARAFFDYLAARPEVRGQRFGTTGYCMGGRTSLMVAGRVPDRVAAAMSFHGGGLVSDDDRQPAPARRPDPGRGVRGRRRERSVLHPGAVRHPRCRAERGRRRARHRVVPGRARFRGPRQRSV